MIAHTAKTHGRFTQTLHWITAILVLLAFASGLGGSEARLYASGNDFKRELHETLGVAIFSVSLLRLMWLAFAHKPAIDGGPAWMKALATSMQRALYALLFLIPITAVMGVWLEGHPLTLLGGTNIAAFAGNFHTFGGLVVGAHTLLGDALIWLAGLHAVAAIFHYLVLRDDVLASMTPAWVHLPKWPDN